VFCLRLRTVRWQCQSLARLEEGTVPLKKLSSERMTLWCGGVARSGLIAVLVGCSSSTNSGELEGDIGAGAGTPSATAASFLSAAAECGALGHQPCDVLEATCQSELAAIAACQWGGAGTPVTVPPVTTLARADLLEQLVMLNESATAPEPSQVALSSVLDLLGLVPANGDAPTTADELSASLALAFYEFDTKQATLVEDVSTGDMGTDDALLFHELVHAQQDARYDLGALLRGVTSTDALASLRSLFEGEAQFHQLLFEMGRFNVSSGPASVKAQLDAFRQQQEPGLFADPVSAWQLSQLLMAYIYGPYLTLEAWSEGGPSAMLELYESPSTRSLRMLESAFGAYHTTDPLQPFPMLNVFAEPGAPPPVEGDEAYPLLADRLGASTVLVIAQLAADPPLARELALGWRGDQLDVFQLQAGAAAGRYRVNFDDAAHAAEFARVLSANPNMLTRTSGTLVVATVSEGETPEWLFGPLAMP
jgi:hypothetical protein